MDHGGPCDTQDSSPEKAGSDGPTHADFAVGEREDLSAVGERDGTLTGAVESGEDIDEHSHSGEMSDVLDGNKTAETCGEQTPSHVREGEEEERAAAEGVDSPDGGPGEDEVYEAETEGGEECVEGIGSVLLKHRRRVEGDDVDSAHLLRDHDRERGEGRAANSRNREKLDKARDVVAIANDHLFNLELAVDIVQVAGGLERVVSQLQQRVEGLLVTVLLHQPTRGFGAVVDENEQRHGRNEGTSELQAPCEGTSARHSEVSGEADKDSEGCPELPCHNEGSTDRGGAVFGGVDGHGGCLGTHSDSEKQAAGQ